MLPRKALAILQISTIGAEGQAGFSPPAAVAAERRLSVVEDVKLSGPVR
jgi:hypothetical protein